VHDPASGGCAVIDCVLDFDDVADERAHNIRVREGISEDGFVAMRSARDATLGMLRPVIPSIQVNMRAGQLPPAEPDGKHFLKVPLNQL
jgi:hypothetical protein